MGGHCLAFPTWAAYPLSLDVFQNIQFIYWFLFCPVYIWLTASSWMLVWFVIEFLAVNIWYTWLVLGILLTNKLKTFQYAATLKETMLFYRQLQIMHVCFLNIVSVLIVAIPIIATKMILFCNCSLIRQHTRMDLLNMVILVTWSIVATCLVSTFFLIWGKLRERSLLVLKVLCKRRRENEGRAVEMKKFVKSCQPFSYSYGRMCVIKTSSVLTFLQGATRGTFRTLLTID